MQINEIISDLLSGLDCNAFYIFKPDGIRGSGAIKQAQRGRLKWDLYLIFFGSGLTHRLQHPKQTLQTLQTIHTHKSWSVILTRSITRC